MSELALNVGADCNLLVSPLKVNVGPMEPEVDELEDEPLELAPELEARNSVQGTATCFPEELDEPEVSEVLDEALEEELLDPPELLKERMAKSTLPDRGFSTTS